MKFEKQLQAVKNFFVKVGKRNLIIVGAVVLIGAAVALNWVFFSRGGGKGSGDTTTPSGEQTGEPASVGSAESYFAASQVSRQRARDEAREVLQAVIDDASADEAAKSEALAGITQMAKDMEAEANIETLVVSKGFEQCVAVISNGAVNVVVKSQGLTAAEVAQINTIVYEQTGISPDKVVIIEKS